MNPPCSNCGSTKTPPRRMCHGWCRGCAQRWVKAGRPESGPPPRQRHCDRDGHLEDLLFLVSTGVTHREMLALRLGVTTGTVDRYLAQLNMQEAS